ncbi:MFS transporter [Kribbella sancticallisti]|uniref:MFS transporter n=1 Tax=Kribbella sancticallisti TaxID=460087 RepID=A0ABN2DNB8_9ACTN
MAPNVSYREVFGVREFRAIWLAEGQSVVGDQLARVALSVLVFSDTGSAALTALAYALTFVPSLLGGIALTSLADRVPRRELMVWIDGLRGALILPVAIPGMPFWTCCVLVGVVSLLQPVFKSAQLALLPEVLGEERYLTGLAIRSVTIQFFQMVGFAGGGLLIALFNPHVVLVLDGLSFFASALLIRILLTPRPAADRSAEDLSSRRWSSRASMRQSWRLLFGEREMRTLVLMLWLMALVTVYEGLAVPYAVLLGGDAVTAGLILAADPLGSIVGAVAFSRWVPESWRSKLLGPLVVAAAVPVAICLLRPGLLLSVMLFVLAGALGTSVVMQATAAITLRTPDSRRGKILGLSNAGLTTGTGLSPLLAGAIADRTDAVQTVGWFGLAGVLAAIPLAVMWHGSGNISRVSSDSSLRCS